MTLLRKKRFKKIYIYLAEDCGKARQENESKCVYVRVCTCTRESSREAGSLECIDFLNRRDGRSLQGNYRENMPPPTLCKTTFY